jgi:hypothetical protein
MVQGNQAGADEEGARRMIQTPVYRFPKPSLSPKGLLRKIGAGITIFFNDVSFESCGGDYIIQAV